MARYRKTKSRGHKATHHRHHSKNPHHMKVMRHRRRRSSNPFDRSMMVMGVGALGGVAATKFISGMIPATVTASLPAQFAPVLTAAGAALATAFVADRFVKGKAGEGAVVGAIAVVGSALLDAFIPNLGPYGINGIGHIMPGMYVVPQNPVTAGMPMVMAPPAPASQSGALSGAFPRPFGH